MRHSFFGGVSLATHKESTRRKPLSRLDQPPAQVVIPLRMSAEGEAAPLVRPGDPVAVGQLIAKGTGLGVSAHASVSGRVAAVEPRPHPWGGLSPAVVIDNDGQDTLWDGLPAPIPPAELNLDLLLERVSQAGIAGMGGGAYPTAEKLRRAAGHADTLIVNAAECEPYVTADHRLLLERSDQILKGARAVARCVGVQRAVLVTEGDKLNAAEAVERRLRKQHQDKVELYTLRTRYPSGAERQIVQTVTGREVPADADPLSARCLVLNVATVYAIQEALSKGLPLIHRAVTVTGGAVARPRNLWVPIGTPLRCLLEAAGGLREASPLILSGGPMMGSPVPDLEAPVIKSTGALLCLADSERRQESAESVCIRCGKCVASCPMHLSPAFISQALRRNELAKLSRLNPRDCIACGCCSYVCPARIPLVELVLRAGELLEKGGIA